MNDQKPDPAAGLAQTAMAKAAKRPADDAEVDAAIPTAKIEPLGRGALKFEESTNNRWRAVSPLGVPHEELNRHAVFWGHCGDDFQSFDTVWLVDAGRTQLSEFVVLDAGPSYADVALARTIKLPPRTRGAESRIPDGYSIVQAGPSDSQRGWLVVRQSDGVTLNVAMPIARREDAIRFLLDHATLRQNDAPRHMPR